MSERFFVGTVSGWLTPTVDGKDRLPPLTAIVFDRALACRNVASYRSEDEGGGHRTAQEMVGRAIQKASEHARRFNEQAARDA